MSAARPRPTADDRLAPLAALARHASSSSAGLDGGDDEAWAALEAASARQARRRRRTRAWAAAGLAALALAGGLGLGRARRAPGLTYVVDGSAGGGAGDVPTAPGADARIRFSDGSEVGLRGGSHARILATGADGAEVRLEDGRARFAVVHRARTRWAVDAGPFVVAVTGTTFEVDWSPAHRRLRVALHTGVVTVRGPLTAGVTLLPGQVLEAQAEDATFRIRAAPVEAAGAAWPVTPGTAPPIVVPPPGPAPPPPESPPAAPAPPGSPGSIDASAGPAPSAAPPAVPPRAPPIVSVELLGPSPFARAGMAAPARARVPAPLAAGDPPLAPVPAEETLPAPPPAAPAPAPALVEPPPRPTWQPSDLGADWSERVARGDFDTILHEVKERGAYNCLRSLPSERLAALAEAARHAGLAELRRRTLVAQRRRFAGTEAAAEAAFQLGRLAEATPEESRSAHSWYQRYLAEAPDGPHAEEALGRQLLLTDQLGAQALNAIAREILDRYPFGAYAPRARAILESGR
jgi:hypothetical protein